MKFINILYILLFLLGCKSTVVDSILLEKYLKSEKGIIVSCLRCECIIEGLNIYMKGNPQAQSITIFADSTCLKSSVLPKSIHIDQLIIDSVYEKNYNVMLFQKKGKSYNFKLIETKNAYELPQLAGIFFSN